GLQQAKPFALDVAAKAEQLYRVLAHVSFDRQHRGLARRGQRLQRPPGAMHLIADAADVEDHVILAVGVDQAFEFADHARCARATITTSSRRTPGPIASVGREAEAAWGSNLPDYESRWLWVPACAGTTRVGYSCVHHL